MRTMDEGTTDEGATAAALSGAQGKLSAKPAGGQKEDSPNLDLLRSFAVLTVMIDHLVPTMVHHGIAVPGLIVDLTAHIGQSGVLAFFVHTSLVLMFSLERMARHHEGRELVSRFYVRRAFRIYPLAIFSILAALALHLPAMTWRDTPPITGRVVVANLLLLQNFWTKQSVLGPLWSLPYEVQMYVVLPALYFLARMARGPSRLAVLFVATCAGGVLVDRVTHGRMNLAAYVPCFFCGVLCYALRGRVPAVISATRWPWFVAAGIAGYCLVHLGQPQPVYWIGWIYCLVLGLAINAFKDSPFALLNAATQKIAMYSYGLYLLHVPVLYLVFDVLGMRNGLLAVPIYFAITQVLSVATYRLLEGPLIALGRRLSD
jgi:peptidoglycan/LPS O-acetylase OafA/YrhL